MSVSEKWTYLNNRGNHFYYKKTIRRLFIILGVH